MRKLNWNIISETKNPEEALNVFFQALNTALKMICSIKNVQVNTIKKLQWYNYSLRTLKNILDVVDILRLSTKRPEAEKEANIMHILNAQHKQKAIFEVINIENSKCKCTSVQADLRAVDLFANI